MTTNSTLHSYFGKSPPEITPQSSHKVQDHQQKEIKVPSDFPFPKRLLGKMSCQANWFEQFNWLHYCESLESVLCFVRMKHEKLGNLKNEKKQGGHLH